VRQALPFLVLAGCVGPTAQLYDGDPRPREDIAVVVLAGYPAQDALRFASEAYLVELDGKPLEREADQFAVLPGAHELTLRWAWTEAPWRTGWPSKEEPGWAKTRGVSKLRLHALAARTYVLAWRPEARAAPVGFKHD
jgi:hypothetical protein